MASKRQRRKRRRRAAGHSEAGDRAGPTAAAPAAPEASARPRSAPARRGASGPPPAPWGSFPLTELVVLVALVMLVAGFFVAPPRGAVMLGTGLILGSLAGLELAAREHLAGYRSHTLLLGGAIGMAVLLGLLLLGPESLPVVAALAAAAVAFSLSAWAFAGIFRRRSGGALVKVRG